MSGDPVREIQIYPVAECWTMTASETGREGRNRLSGEKSPYLLQHAGNPVDWYPWGEEAFGLAKRLDRPVFLSIGYASCHWCHVMARESFEDPEVAALLNASFVCVKVDREERPDVDQLYMEACQLLSGTGGWPLSVITTPDGRPFFAATYIPKDSRFGMIGLLELVPRIREMWRVRRDDLVRTAAQVRDALSVPPPGGRGPPGPELSDAAFQALSGSYDRVHGGFGNAPKFPAPHVLLFLLRYWYRTGHAPALQMAGETLIAMGRGGIHDHIGGGFHRYSTDARWLVPHFEKMLYDQAMIILASAELYRATGDRRFFTITEDCAEYVLLTLKAPDGGFCSSEDAESGGEEGGFYRWTRGEILELLGSAEGELFAETYRVTSAGNYLGPGGGRDGTNILHQIEPEEATAKRLGIPADRLSRTLSAGRRLLFEARERRVRPARDDSCLADWNGLAIAALAFAGRTLREPRYIAAAEGAAGFLLSRMISPDGGLWHRYREGEAGVPGMAGDYAAVTFGLLELFAAVPEAPHLEDAIRLHRLLMARFSDQDGALYTVAGSHEPLIVRVRADGDGALPSPLSLAAHNAVRLSRLTGEPGFEEDASRLLASAAPAAARYPIGHCFLLCALEVALASIEVVVAGDPENEEIRALIDAAQEGYHPSLVFLQVPSGEAGTAIVRIAPFAGSLREPGAYVCRGNTCSPPVKSPEALRQLLGTGRGKEGDWDPFRGS
jgi:uncharacterized protein YyaL (SSP411 family)